MADLLPPVDFPVYGLDSSWGGPRWVDFVEGKQGEPPWGLWLAHGTTVAPHPNETWIKVISLASDRSGDVRENGRAAVEVAFAAAFALLNLTYPDASPTRRDELARGVVRRAEQQADRWPQWDTATWSADGRAIAAKVWHWAGAWVGFSTELATTDVIVAGGGLSTNAIALTSITDGSPYHVDLTQPMAYPQVIEASRQVALGGQPDPDHARWPMHPDHATL